MTENEVVPQVSSKGVVTLSYMELANKDSDVSEKLKAGFGPAGLGIIAVSGVPEFPRLRMKLLPLAQRVASLPEEVKKQLEDPPSRFSFGWSHGKEKLESGRPDQLKGSFYANLCKNTRTDDVDLIERYPTQCRDNLWPNDDLPELEQVMMELGSLIIEVGFLVAYHCDKYGRWKPFMLIAEVAFGSRIVLGRMDSSAFDRSLLGKTPSVEDVLKRSRCHKGRLLHYFPSSERYQDEDLSSWCGWHRDISSLTGLAHALYTKDAEEVPSPDREAGLYIENRAGEVVKAIYDANHLAFQMGEATEIMSGGLFHATPHCVKAPKQEVVGVARNSFAVFMQPHWDETLDGPVNRDESLKKVCGSPTMSFGDFSESRLQNYNYDVVV